MSTEFFIVNVLLFFVGMIILTKSSDKFVDGSVFLAKKLGISEIVIGLTLVSIGTSLPELATNIYSAINGTPGIALGNAIGSNITNILLALGAVLVVKNFIISRKVFYRDAMVLLVFYLIFSSFIYLSDSILNRWQGIFLILSCIGYIYYLIRHSNELPIDENSEENPEKDKIDTIPKSLLWIFISICLITFGAKLMVDNIVWIATKFSIPDAIISATIVAIGTSLPEIAVTIAGVKKAKPDIVIGNILGSCIFNLLLVMGTTITIKPLPVDNETRFFLIPWMLISGLLCVLFMRIKFCLLRWHGVVFCILYTIFLIINILKIVK
ncbi:MAG: calcium/sodium antiporter [Lentisphaeria bacterium]